MKLELKNGLTRKLSSVKILAIIPNSLDIPIKCCGLNIRMEHNQKTENNFDDYITSYVSKSKTVRGYIIGDNIRIPIDIHGGNTNECYFGYINPTIFQENLKRRKL